MQIPFRSKSDSSVVNAFVRQTAEGLDRIFATYRQLTASLANLEEAFYLQGLAVSQRVAELEAALALPVQQGGQWKQVLPASVFSAGSNGEVNRVYRQGWLQSARRFSCLTVQTADGEEIIPNSVNVRVSPDLPAGGTETDPRSVLAGFVPWRRRFPPAFEPTAVLEVELPRDVLGNALLNRIEIIPYPLYGVYVEEVALSGGGGYVVVSNGPASGPLCLHPRPVAADTVRITLRQEQPLLVNQENFYCLGLSRVAIGEVTPVSGQGVFTARVQLAGNGPWRLVGCSVQPALAGQEVSITAGGEAVSAVALPVSVSTGEIEVCVRLTAVEGCPYPHFERVELTYESN
jgi:hypothetical protein